MVGSIGIKLREVIVSPPKKGEQEIEELEDEGNFETIIQPAGEEGYENTSLQNALKKIKAAQAPLDLDLTDHEIGEAEARLLSEAIKEARVPLTLDLSDKAIGDAGIGFLAEAIKEVRAPLNLSFSRNPIGEAGIVLLAEAIKEAQFPLELKLSYNGIVDAGAKFLAQSIKEARVPLTLDLSYNAIGDVGIGFLAEAIKEARVPLTLDFSPRDYIGVNAIFLVGQGQPSLHEAQNGNFVVDARSNPLRFLSSIEFSPSMRMMEQELDFPSALINLVKCYIGDDDLAWIDVAAIRAIEGASHENKYDSINYELLTAAYFTQQTANVLPGLIQDIEQMEDDEQDERKATPQSSSLSSSSRPRKRKRDSGDHPIVELIEEEQYYNASSVGDGGASGSSSSSSFSSFSSYSSSPPSGGGEAQLDELDSQQSTAMNSLIAQVVNSVQEDNNERQATSESEDLLKKFLTCIKDISEELQPHILSSFSIQQLLKFLETTLNPNKFIEDQLTSGSMQFETEHHFGNFTGASQIYAQSNIDAPVSIDEYKGEQLNSGILIDSDPLQLNRLKMDGQVVNHEDNRYDYLLIDIGKLWIQLDSLL